MPQGPERLARLIDFRGAAVPMVDFRLRLGLAAVPPTSATRVLNVSDFLADVIDAAPDIGTLWRPGYIDGVVKRADGFVLLLVQSLIISAEEDCAAL